MSLRDSQSSQSQSYYRHRALTCSSSRSWDPSLQPTSVPGDFYPLVDSSLNPAFQRQSGLLAPGLESQSNIPLHGRERTQSQGLSGYDMSGVDAYLTAQMAHNSNHYNWQNQPLRSPLNMDQTLPHPQSLSPAYPMGYGAQQGSSQSYFPPTNLSGQYLAPIQPSLRSQSHPRSASMSYSLPSHSPGGSPPALSDHSYVSPPPSYVLNQSNYYMPDTSPLPSHTSSMAVSPHPPAPIPADTLYSSPEFAQTSSDPDHQVRVISFRPRPQCWDHGCNGREFSTFSNLLRHQREKSGVVAKAECPMCGAAFTRTTARNIHVAQGKCKGSGAPGPAGGKDSSADQYYS